MKGSDVNAAFGEVTSAKPARLAINHFTKSFMTNEEYDINSLDISKKR
jgi:hypothetical protein